ncbi:MAG: DUF4956 domain-containing protein [Bacillota bacterium]
MLLDTIFASLFGTSSLDIAVITFVICIVAALGLGFFNAWMYTLSGSSSKSFVTTLSIIPAIVCMIIMMVNGNIGTGVAVAGAFSLIRFRSVPGTAKEIGGIFIAMGTGISLGMGYVGFAIIFVLLVALFNYLVSKSSFGSKTEEKRVLRVTIPEDLNYSNMFDDLFAIYTESASLSSVKTSNMGSLYKLNYQISMKNAQLEKEFIDAIRCRNGNLEVSIIKEISNQTEL